MQDAQILCDGVWCPFKPLDAANPLHHEFIGSLDNLNLIFNTYLGAQKTPGQYIYLHIGPNPAPQRKEDYESSESEEEVSRQFMRLNTGPRPSKRDKERERLGVAYGESLKNVSQLSTLIKRFASGSAPADMLKGLADAQGRKQAILASMEAYKLGTW